MCPKRYSERCNGLENRVQTNIVRHVVRLQIMPSCIYFLVAVKGYCTDGYCTDTSYYETTSSSLTPAASAIG